MSSTKDNLKKRRAKKVQFDGDEFHVTSMTIAEADYVDKLSEDPARAGEIIGFCLSKCLVEADGKPVFDTDFEADPIAYDADIRLLPIETALFLSQEIRNRTNPPDFSAAKKN